MKQLLPIFALLAAIGASAQLTTITASGIQDGSGSPLTGTFCVGANACAAVTSGTLASLKVTNPTIGTVTITSGSSQYLNMPNVSISGTTFDWDAYKQPTATQSTGIGIPYWHCIVGATFLNTAGTNYSCSSAGAWATVSASAVWGGITGTLSAQTDLNTALGLKAPAASPTFSGIVTTPITGSTQCLHVNTSGVVSGIGADCGTGTALSGQTTNSIPLATSATASTTSSSMAQGAGGQITIGSATNVAPSQDPTLSVQRVVGSTTSHGMAVDDVLSGGTNSYASFDDRVELNGANSINHIAGYQSIPTLHTGYSGTLTNLINFVGYANINGGTVTNRYGYEVNDVVKTGSGAVGTQYGVYVNPLSAATTNWGVYVESNPSLFGGLITAQSNLKLTENTPCPTPEAGFDFICSDSVAHAVTISNNGSGYFTPASSGGSTAFSAITAGTNSSAALIVGSGASLDVSGTGTNNATKIGGITITGTPSSGMSPVATSSSAATWQTPASTAGAMTLITDTLLGSPAATVTFSSISGSYKTLVLYVTVACSASSNNDTLYMQANADTAANYNRQYLITNLAASTAGQTIATANLGGVPVPCATATANGTGSYIVTIPNYSGTTFSKIARMDGSYFAGNGATFITQAAVTWYWTNTAAITQLVFGIQGGSNLVTGSRITLYGIN